MWSNHLKTGQKRVWYSDGYCILKYTQEYMPASHWLCIKYNMTLHFLSAKCHHLIDLEKSIKEDWGIQKASIWEGIRVVDLPLIFIRMLYMKYQHSV